MTEAILTHAIELPDHGLRIGTLLVEGKFWVGVHDGSVMRKLTPDAARGYARFLEDGVYAQQMKPVISALDGVAEIVESAGASATAKRAEKFEPLTLRDGAPSNAGWNVADMPVEGHA